MGKIRIFNGNNSVYISDRAYQPGSLTASNRGNDVKIVKNTNNKTIVNEITYDLIVDKDGNAWGTDGPSTVTALNNYIGATNPDGIIKSTDKITSLSGITESDFQSKPGFGVFVGDTDGSLKTTSEFVFDGSNLNLNGGLYFAGDKTIGSTGTSGTITIDPATAINFFGEYSFPTTDGSSGQVIQTDGLGNLSFVTPSGGSPVGSSPWTTSGSDIYYTTGNVGIGTATPAAALHVSGKAIIDSGNANVFIGDSTTAESITTGQNNLAIGATALRSASSNTRYAVAIGAQAGRFGTQDHGISIGYGAGWNGAQSSTYIGSQAGKNAAGQSNVGIGYESGGGASASVQNLTGNVSIGSQAGRVLETNATAVGYRALTALTTGTSNTAVGYQAGAALTTGGSNTFLGYQAGQNVTGQPRNVAVGYLALSSSPSSYDNTAIGSESLKSLVSVYNNNVAIGKDAAKNVAATSTSVFVGASSSTVSNANFDHVTAIGFASQTKEDGVSVGRGSTGGTSTVTVGRSAGNSSSNFSVFLGYNAGASETNSNRLYIENSNSTTPLIYGEFDNDLIRVNGDLEVKGYADVELGASETFTVHDGTHDLFQVDTGTTGTIFSVNDVSGLPKLTVDDSDGVTIDKFKEVKYEKPSNTDFSYQGDVVYFGATTGMTQGDLYYYNPSGNWAQADADAVSSSGSVLLAIALGTASDTDGMLLKGTFTMAAGAIDGTEATGDELYVSTTAGHVTSDVSAYTTGDVVRVIGYCLDGTNGQIWFNPSNDFITLA